MQLQTLPHAHFTIGHPHEQARRHGGVMVHPTDEFHMQQQGQHFCRPPQQQQALLHPIQSQQQFQVQEQHPGQHHYQLLQQQQWCTTQLAMPCEPGSTQQQQQQLQVPLTSCQQPAAAGQRCSGSPANVEHAAPALTSSNLALLKVATGSPQPGGCSPDDAGRPNSSSSTATQTGWQLGQQTTPSPGRDSDEQQQELQLSAQVTNTASVLPSPQQQQHRQQEQHYEQRLQQVDDPPPRQQQGPGQLPQHVGHQQQEVPAAKKSSRPWDWWRGTGGSSMWHGLDPLRAPLLQAHTMLGDRSSCSQQLLALLGGHAAAAAEGSSVQHEECWEQLQAVAAAAAAKWQQQLMVLEAAAAAAAGGNAAVMHPGHAVPEHVMKHLQQRLHQDAQQQQLALQQQQSRLKRSVHALDGPASAVATPAAIVAAAFAAVDVDSRRGERAAVDASQQRQQQHRSLPAPAAEPQQQKQRQQPPKQSCAARPPMPKGSKRPWQPKMAPDEPNWNQAAFSSIVARTHAAAEVGPLRNVKYPKPLPEHSTARFAMLILLHSTGWPNHLLWERWQEAHQPGEVALMVHMKAGVELGLSMPGREAIAKHKLKVAVNACWGDVSLVQAQIDSIAEVLRRCPNVTHIGLGSGHDIPLQLMSPDLLMPGVSMFGAYQFGEKESRALKVATYDELTSVTGLTDEEAQAWSNSLLFHHQWMVLSREHAAAVVALRQDILTIGRVMHKACNSVQAGMAPDEFILVTALRCHGYVRSIQRVEVKPGMRYPPGSMLNSYPTLVLFPAESSPHPVTWTDPDEKIKCQVERHTGQQYFKLLSLRECLKISVDRCALFFRKVEIRQIRTEELIRLLSCLEELWAGRGVNLAGGGGHSTSSAGTSGGSGKRGGKRKRGQHLIKGPLGKVLEADGSPAVSPAVSSAAETCDVADTESGLEAADGDEAEQQPPAKRAVAA